MAKYHTLQGVQNRVAVIYAYRGTDQDNTLTAPVPPDSKALAQEVLPANFSQAEVDKLVYHRLIDLALADPGKLFLIREDRGVLTFWQL